MQLFWIASHVALWLFLAGTSFLLLGVLRALALAQWRIEQLEAITPSRLNRNGLAVGKQAPAFALQSTAGEEITLAQFAGRRLLLVFVQDGCGPCREIVPELNRLRRRGDIQVAAIIHAAPDAAAQWAAHAGAEFPVLVQSQLAVSKRYEAFATPFAFLIDDSGLIAAKGLVTSPQQIRFVLEEADKAATPGRGEFAPAREPASG